MSERLFLVKRILTSYNPIKLIFVRNQHPPSIPSRSQLLASCNPYNGTCNYQQQKSIRTPKLLILGIVIFCVQAYRLSVYGLKYKTGRKNHNATLKKPIGVLHSLLVVEGQGAHPRAILCLALSVLFAVQGEVDIVLSPHSGSDVRERSRHTYCCHMHTDTVQTLRIVWTRNKHQQSQVHAHGRTGTHTRQRPGASVYLPLACISCISCSPRGHCPPFSRALMAAL